MNYFLLFILKIFKVLDVPLFKQGFNLEINNDSIILVSIELLNFYKTANFYDRRGDYDLKDVPSLQNVVQ